MRRTYVRLWKAAKEQSKELLEEYMSYRCIDDWESADLQIHNQLDYYDDDNKLVGQLPCMLARVVTADGRLAGLHRTYLHKHKDGSFTTKKKLTPMVQTMSGGAIRLYGTEGRSHMCVAEGIESALSLRSMLNGTPAWAAISASNMEKMAIPEHVEHVYIGGDNDANFTGQKAAYALANRLSVQGKKRCVVRCDWDGNDANDELRNREG